MTALLAPCEALLRRIRGTQRARFVPNGKGDRVRDETQLARPTVQYLGALRIRFVVVCCEGDDWAKSRLGEPTTLSLLLQHAGGGVDVIDDHDSGGGRHVQIAEHVALREGCNQHFFGIPPVGIAPKNGGTGAINIVPFTRGTDAVLAPKAAMSRGALAAITAPPNIDGKAVLMTH
jgi:hypothetical protein